MSVDKFFVALREEQDRSRAAADHVGRARERAALPKELRSATRPRSLTFGIAAALALAAGIVLFVARAGAPSGALEFSVGAKSQAGRVGAFIAAPSAGELPLRFSDGTQVALSAGAGARVLSVETNGAHIVLEKGRASASVVHQPGTHWRVDAGPFEIAVVGTRFDVSWDPSEQVMGLVLKEGAVVVSGSFLRESMRVGAGQSLHAFCNEARAELVDDSAPRVPQAELVVAPAPAPATPLGAAPATPSGPAPATPSGPAPTPVIVSAAASTSWQALAGSGKFREALALVEQLGFEAECRGASGQDLLTLGDAARLAGSTPRAREAYLAARAKLPGGGRATYGLGLTAFDQQRDFASSARWFETYLREQPSGALRAEASGRLLESLSRSGQTARAREASEQYLARYPKGAHAALARRLR